LRTLSPRSGLVLACGFLTDGYILFLTIFGSI
jgi:hypothetical protein